MKLVCVKQGVCQHCREKVDQDLYKVKYKGRNQYWCDACLRGYFIEKDVPDKEIDSYFDNQ